MKMNGYLVYEVARHEVRHHHPEATGRATNNILHIQLHTYIHIYTAERLVAVSVCTNQMQAHLALHFSVARDLH